MPVPTPIKESVASNNHIQSHKHEEATKKKRTETELIRIMGMEGAKCCHYIGVMYGAPAVHSF